MTKHKNLTIQPGMVSIKEEIETGERLYAQGKLDEAALCFETVIKNGLKLAEVFNNLGVISFKKGELIKSSRYFILALEIDPEYTPALINGYAVHKEIRQQDAFIPYLESYHRQHPDNIDVKSILMEASQQTAQLQKQAEIGNSPHKNKALLNLKTISEADGEEVDQAQRIKLLIKSLNQSTYQKNKPHRNLIITGIPGSGIDMFAGILNRLENIFCLEPWEKDVFSLPQMFVDQRNSIVNGQGHAESSTQSIRHQAYDENMIIGVKLNIAYLHLNALQKIRQNELNTLFNCYGYRVIAIIRDPVETIATWNTNGLNEFPESIVMEQERSSRWQNICFESNSKIMRQAQLWEFYAQLFQKLMGVIKIYTFEQISHQFETVIKDVCHFLTLDTPDSYKWSKPVFTPIEYNDRETITSAVTKYCLTRNAFGYNVSHNAVPGIWDNYAAFTGTHAQIVNLNQFTGGLSFTS